MVASGWRSESLRDEEEKKGDFFFFYIYILEEDDCHVAANPFTWRNRYPSKTDLVHEQI